VTRRFVRADEERRARSSAPTNQARGLARADPRRPAARTGRRYLPPPSTRVTPVPRRR